MYVCTRLICVYKTHSTKNNTLRLKCVEEYVGYKQHTVNNSICMRDIAKKDMLYSKFVEEYIL